MKRPKNLIVGLNAKHESNILFFSLSLSQNSSCGSFQGSNVIVGAYRSGSTDNGAVRVSVSNEAKHPNYNDNTVENDFLLLRLSEPVTMTTNVVLTLNDQYATPTDGEDLTVLGLGATSEGGSSASILRDVVVQAIDTNECNQAYNGDVDDASMFCAGVDGGGKDSCQGDSGGPIVKRIGDQHVQVGVVSWGEGCARYVPSFILFDYHTVSLSRRRF